MDSASPLAKSGSPVNAQWNAQGRVLAHAAHDAESWWTRIDV
ncbi:hypothetical protein [Candidatus Poriferisodalis sp.]